MAIRFRCPACGNTDVAPSQMAGERVHCRKCGQKVKLPGTAAAAVEAAPLQPETTRSEESQSDSLYQCGSCGQQYDVGDVYNQQGVVICKDCFARQQEAEAASEESSADEPVAPTACASCGTTLEEGVGENVDGQILCASCAMMAATQAARTPAALNRSRVAPQKTQPGYLGWIIGGAIAAVVLIGIMVLVRSASHRSEVADTSTAPNVTTPVRPAPVIVPPQPDTPAPPVQDNWNAKNLPTLVDLRRQGLDQEAAGNLAAASAAYDQLIKLAETAPHPNDAVTGQLQDARAARQAIEAKLAAAKPPTPAPDPTPTPTPRMPAVTTDATPAAPVVAPAGGPWEAQHRDQIVKLLAKANERMTANDSFSAALLYQQLFGLVGGHLPDIQDAALKQQITTAAATRGKLLVQLKSSPESVSVTAGTLLAAGLAALNDQHWQASLESLTDVRQLFERNVSKPSDRLKDPNYVMALHGLAIAYLNLKQVPKAGELFDDNAPLGSMVDRQPTREMVINRAVTDIIQRTKAMRAAKSIKQYMEKHPDAAADEPMVNLLGTSLFIAEQHTTAKAFLQQCAVLYDKESKQLEETRPGEKRWGVEWLPAAEAERKFADRQKALDTAAELSQASVAAYNEWQLQQQLYQPHGPSGMRSTSLANVKASENRYNNLVQAASEAKKKIPDLTWLTQMDPVLPPLPKEIKVASAEPVNSTDPAPPVLTIPTYTLSGSSADSDPTPASPTEVRPPVHVSVPRHALAFAIDKRRLISSAEVLGTVNEVRMEDSQGLILSAHVTARQGDLALLELDAGQMAGGQLRYLSIADTFAGGPIQCAAVPQENVFGPQPSMLTGQAAAPPAQGPWAVSLSDHPRLAGSPLLDAQGQLVGVVVAKREDMRTRLPAAGVREIRQLLSGPNAAPAAPGAGWDASGVFEVTVQQD